MMKRASFLRTAVALLLVHPAAAATCEENGGFARTCSREACLNGVDGCVYNSVLSDECGGVAQECMFYSDDKGACKSQYGCSWELTTGEIMANISFFIAFIVVMAGLGYALRRCLVRKRALTTTAPSYNEREDGITDKSMSDPMPPSVVAIPTGSGDADSRPPVEDEQEGEEDDENSEEQVTDEEEEEEDDVAEEEGVEEGVEVTADTFMGFNSLAL